MKSMNKVIDMKDLDQMVKELEMREEFNCSGNLCGGYSGVCAGVVSPSSTVTVFTFQAW